MSKDRYPGGSRGKAGIETEALARLLKHYRTYEPFLESCREAQLELENPLASPTLQQVLGTLGPAAAEKVGERLLMRMVWHEVIEALARRWNLDRIPGILESLHWNFDGVARPGGRIGTQPLHSFISVSRMLLVPLEFTVSFEGHYWTWAVTRTESLKCFRARVMRDLGITRVRSLPPELRERFRELTKETSSARRYLSDTPHALEPHVYWLFLRLCPQQPKSDPSRTPDRPLTIPEIVDTISESAEREPHDERHVRRAVKALAKVLRIDLPPGRRGALPSRLPPPGLLAPPRLTP